MGRLHPIGKNLVNLYRRKEWMPWAGSLCLVALLMATMLQAAHFCAFLLPGARNTVQAHGASRTGSPCLICLMAQAATAALLLSNFLLVSRSCTLTCLYWEQPPVLWDSFRLYVRPPPAY